MITPLSKVFSVAFWNKHPTVTTLRAATADGIGTVWHGFESRLTRAASSSRRLRSESGRFRTAPDSSWRLLVGPVYSGGSVVCKASIIGIEISPTPPLISTGKGKNCEIWRRFQHHSTWAFQLSQGSVWDIIQVRWKTFTGFCSKFIQKTVCQQNRLV